MNQNLNDYTRIIGQLRMSRNNKIKHGWSRDIGLGFVRDDIISLKSLNKQIEFSFRCGKQLLQVNELNLRETEEAIDFCKEQLNKTGLTYHELEQRKLDERFQK